ncbi:MAG: carboxylesterase family protein [bacterium]
MQGERIGDTWRYLALPFAAPPVGPLRWRPPAPPACHDGVRFTTTYGPACPQLEDGVYSGDEDCLHLNIWTPAAAPADGAPRPVLFFIHGGGNVQGSASVGAAGAVLYDGQRLAERFGVVVVVTQYRLGPLAWLVHPALADAAGRSGNHGTRDQIAALDWTRRNIAAFGGDPDRVTLFGESAGGRNICTLIASPPAAGLFHGAIIQSGGCVQPSPEQVAAVGLEIITAAGCADAPDIETCMRALGARELLEARPPIVEVAGRSDALQPYADGEILLGQPEDIIAAGQHNDVPIIIGANADETSTSTPPIATEAAYEAALRATLGPLTDRVLELYPASDYDSPQAAYIQVTTDAKFVCGARRAARAAAVGGQSPVYLYHFTQNLSRAPRLAPAGAYHGIELFFVWQQMDFANYRATPQELALAEAIGGYWTRFAADGTPGGLPPWPAYEAATDEAIVFHGDGIEVISGIRAAKCDFWDALDPG